MHQLMHNVLVCAIGIVQNKLARFVQIGILAGAKKTALIYYWMCGLELKPMLCESATLTICQF